MPALAIDPGGRVRAEWLARIAAEYTSAAVTQHLVLWLMQAGGPPDLVDEGLAIVADELLHARMSHDVYRAAGGTAPPVIDRQRLGLQRTDAPLERDILSAGVRVFCLGETVAVPLFACLRERCTEPTARAALDRILRDEVRHRDFGWDLLDWSLETGAAPSEVERELPAMLLQLEELYGAVVPASLDDAGAGEMSELERAWGLAPARDYAVILARTVQDDFRPRFAARGIGLPSANGERV